MNQRGVLSYGFIILILAIAGIFFGAIAAPVIENVSLTSYKAAEPIIRQNEVLISQIEDQNMRTTLQGVVNDTKSFQTQNITLWHLLGAFSAIITIILIAIVLHLKARQDVEVTAYGGGIR